jgi:hypothetical protein
VVLCAPNRLYLGVTHHFIRIIVSSSVPTLTIPEGCPCSRLATPQFLIGGLFRETQGDQDVGGEKKPQPQPGVLQTELRFMRTLK